MIPPNAINNDVTTDDVVDRCIVVEVGDTARPSYDESDVFLSCYIYGRIRVWWKSEIATIIGVKTEKNGQSNQLAVGFAAYWGGESG